MELKLRLLTEAHQELGFINIGATSHDFFPSVPPMTATREHILGFQPLEGWAVFILPLSVTTIMLPAAGRYLITHPEADGTEPVIGEFIAGLVDPLPLTAERIAAIKSDPNAVKAVRIVLGYNKCHDECKAYAGLEKSETLQAEGFIWYTDLPGKFVCSCGTTEIGLDS